MQHLQQLLSHPLRLVWVQREGVPQRAHQPVQRHIPHALHRTRLPTTRACIKRLHVIEQHNGRCPNSRVSLSVPDLAV